MNSATEQSPTTRRWRGDLGFALESRISRLQSEYLAGSPSARADLARLRRGLGKPAGSVPEIWDLTVGAVPAKLSWDRDEPSRAEQAAHAALTLYALHQQSMSSRVHVPEVSFGTAVRNLARGGTQSEEAVTRRFMAVATAESIDELLTHVRGLVTQLKKVEPPIRGGLDYARFADDMLALLTPGREHSVRLQWGRDFYRTNTETANDDTTDERTQK